ESVETREKKKHKILLNILKRIFWKDPLKMLFFTLFSISFAILNPFGLYGDTSQESRILVQQIMSHFYPSRQQERKPVTVLLYDVDSPAALYTPKNNQENVANARKEAAWPISYQKHAEVLEMLLRTGPKAVFVDILFHRNDEDGAGVKALAGVAKRYAEKKIPLFFADTPYEEPEKKDPPQTPSIKSWIRPELSEVVARVGVDEISSAGDRGERYRLAPKRHLLPPAAALYQVSSTGRDRPLPDNPEDLYLQWGRIPDLEAHLNAVPGQEPEELKPENLEPQATAQGRWKAFCSYILKALGQGVVKPEKFKIPHYYHPCVYVSIWKGLRQASAKKWKERCRDIEKKLLRDHFVLVGTGLREMPDREVSPIHGYLPGVFFHAMVLDNLLTYGQGYWRYPKQLCGSLTLASLLDIFALLFTLRIYTEFTAWLKRWKHEHGNPSWMDPRPLIFVLLFYLTVFVFSLGLALVALKILTIAPFNFIGTTLLMAGIGMENFKPQAIQG
ncbi:CHASE2 domain-containing protein, partial [Desulfobacter sp.]|uniref:CHASE2 domain-containing protein n=1 Tax=Desulfobacter sp. TaxID=2294 RepID=UPI003D0B5BDB